MPRTTILALLSTLVLAALLPGCINLSAFPPPQIREEIVTHSPRRLERNRVALIEVEGFLGWGGGGTKLLGGTGVADVRERLQRAATDERVRAVVLRINSPGGEVGACDAMHQDVLRFRRTTGKPVVAACVDLAASGGFYVACACDQIVAAPTSVIGSVGVVMHLFNAEGLMQKIGLRASVIKSGEMKDIGSPTRTMTPPEQQVMQGVIDSLFARFQEVVRQGRPAMNDADVLAISDGRIVTAAEAQRLHMVDQAGYLDDALALSMRLAGIKSADVILYRSRGGANSNIYAAYGPGDLLALRGLDLLRSQGPGFLYLWAPAP